MSKMHVIRMSEAQCEKDIVFMKPSETLYVSNEFYKEDNDKIKKSFPVKVSAIHVGWILGGSGDTAYGLQFLKGIS